MGKPPGGDESIATSQTMPAPANGCQESTGETCAQEDDAALVRRAQADPQAFGDLYRRYVRRVYTYLYYRTGRVEEAEDLTAQTFARALAHLPRYDERGLPFSAWLLRIAHNLAANWHRDRSRHRLVRLEVSAGEVRAFDDPEEQVAAAAEAEQVRAAVRRLPPERQHLLLMKFVFGLSNAEIARAMNRTEGAVKALLHRTIVALRQLLDREGMV
jgi:RNA polymerase sigma-70 factor (ECF subfamily)